MLTGKKKGLELRVILKWKGTKNRRFAKISALDHDGPLREFI